MNTTQNTKGETVKRVIRVDFTDNACTEITQVPASDGGWWNIKVERVGR